eukprot:3832396-Pyramimonas_sp.AAC.1
MFAQTCATGCQMLVRPSAPLASLGPRVERGGPTWSWRGDTSYPSGDLMGQVPDALLERCRSETRNGVESQPRIRKRCGPEVKGPPRHELCVMLSAARRCARGCRCPG